MKNYITIIVAFLFCCTTNLSVYAQNWIPYQGYQTQTVQVTNTYPVVFYPNPQPVVVHQWTPYIIPQTTVIEHQCWFRRTQKVVTEPVIQWIYTPIVAYK